MPLLSLSEASTFVVLVDNRCRSGFLFVNVLLGLSFLFSDLLHFRFVDLVHDAGTFPPGFTVRSRLSRVCGDFTTIDVLKALGLAFQFGAKFFFRHFI